MSKTQPQNPPTSLARDKLGLPSSKTEDQEVVTNCSKGGGSRPSWPSHALSSVFCSPTTPGGGEKGSNAWNCPSSPFFSVVHPSILHRRGVGTSVEGKRRKKKKASCIAGLRVASQRPLNPVPFLACPPASPVPTKIWTNTEREKPQVPALVQLDTFDSTSTPPTRTNKPHESSTTSPPIGDRLLCRVHRKSADWRRESHWRRHAQGSRGDTRF